MTRVVKEYDVRRDEILTCAQQLFYTRGFERTSIRDIIETIGIAKGTFYHYFSSKQALLEALINQLSEQSMALIEPIVVDESLTATEKLVGIYNASNQWKLEQRAGLLKIMRAYLSENNLVLRTKLLESTAQLAVRPITHVIAQGVSEGVFDVHDSRHAAEIMYAMSQRFSLSIAELILDSADAETTLDEMNAKVAATQQAIERVLGAAPGSLPLFSSKHFAAWIERDA